MQATGFLADFILFLLPAVLWDQLTGSKRGTKIFQFIYFFSSFWNQFGPNCTTFLVAGAYPAVPALHGTRALLSMCALFGMQTMRVVLARYAVLSVRALTVGTLDPALNAAPVFEKVRGFC